MRFRRLKKDLL